MEQGLLAIVLHAHLPFVRHPEYPEFLEEEWLFEAISETYLPLLFVFENLVADGDPRSPRGREAVNREAFLCLTLHAHLPFVRHPEHEVFFEESWYFEAVAETYTPLSTSDWKT